MHTHTQTLTHRMDYVRRLHNKTNIRRARINTHTHIPTIVHTTTSNVSLNHFIICLDVGFVVIVVVIVFHLRFNIHDLHTQSDSQT